MNVPDESEIETLLRSAPKPTPPRGLKETLRRQTHDAPADSALRPSILASSQRSWFRRWWPALAPASVGLACAAVLTMQQMEIRDLKQTIQSLSTSPPATSVPTNAAVRRLQSAPVPDSREKEAVEISQLKEQVGKLTAEIARLEQMRAENQDLHAKLSAPAGGLTPEEAAGMAEMEKARERAQMIACVNNMKQLGISARVWAGDNEDRYPPDIVCMSNEMNTPKILVCPADTGRVAAPNFGSFTPANCSYEWFLNPQGDDKEPTRVLTRCPIHGNIGMYDGSVQSRVAKAHPDWFVQRNGKLYYEPPPRANSPDFE